MPDPGLELSLGQGRGVRAGRVGWVRAGRVGVVMYSPSWSTLLYTALGTPTLHRTTLNTRTATPTRVKTVNGL